MIEIALETRKTTWPSHEINYNRITRDTMNIDAKFEASRPANNESKYRSILRRD